MSPKDLKEKIQAQGQLLIKQPAGYGPQIAQQFKEIGLKVESVLINGSTPGLEVSLDPDFVPPVPKITIAGHIYQPGSFSPRDEAEFELAGISNYVDEDSEAPNFPSIKAAEAALNKIEEEIGWHKDQLQLDHLNETSAINKEDYQLRVKELKYKAAHIQRQIQKRRKEVSSKGGLRVEEFGGVRVEIQAISYNNYPLYRLTIESDSGYYQEFKMHNLQAVLRKRDELLQELTDSGIM